MEYSHNLASLLIVATMLAILVIVPTSQLAAASPRSAGYDHGCSDASLPASDRYINQPDKGPADHTAEFVDGYNDGFSTCSGSSNDGGGRSSGNGRHFEDNPLLRAGCTVIADPVSCETARGIIHGLRNGD